ncbi:hypothetical protein FH972_021342 [Carpinus fangiana]|uniref:Enoyl reductase (ER) domain-containing protein n=1 Tax=Carpinus fangiana TaxID=176857 RepID=A0A5N6KP35_9ROSI|nr:hypothetical protein FH972_021342 [Carpinus fangiana]
MPAGLVMEKVEGKPGQVYYPIKVVDIPTPAVKDNEVVVKMSAASLNHRDLFCRQALYPKVAFGIPLFADGCGTVISTGPAASKWKGKRVIINPGSGWKDDLDGPEDPTGYKILGGTSMNPIGTGVEELVIDASELEEAPSHLSAVEVSALSLTGLTAWRATQVKARAAMAPGKNILVTGIGGGVALMALLFATKAGANVYVTSGNQEKIDKAIKLGAKGGVIYKEQGWDKTLQSQLGKGNRLDAIIDGAGSDIVAKGARLLKDGGVISIYGMTTSPQMTWSMAAVLRNIELKGSTMGSRKEFADMLLQIGYHVLADIGGRWKSARFHIMNGCPAEPMGSATVEGRVVNEKASAGGRDTSLLLRLGKHLYGRLADKFVGAIVTVGDTLEQVIDTKQLDHSVGVVDVGISEQPRFHLGAVKAKKEAPQLLVALDDVVECIALPRELATLSYFWSKAFVWSAILLSSGADYSEHTQLSMSKKKTTRSAMLKEAKESPQSQTYLDHIQAKVKKKLWNKPLFGAMNREHTREQSRWPMTLLSVSAKRAQAKRFVLKCWVAITISSCTEDFCSTLLGESNSCQEKLPARVVWCQMALATTPAGQLPSAQLQADFYAKLARLQDDILTNKHPRLSLPDVALRELAAFASSPPLVPNLSSYETTSGSAPGVGPVSLARPDGSAKSEVRLKRQQIEKVLAQAVEVKKVRDKAIRLQDKADRDHVFWDAPHVFDTSQVLDTALKIVKPVSGWAPVAANPSSPESSFNENEYYSSQVMSPATSASHRSLGQPVLAETHASQPAPAFRDTALDALSIASSSERDDSYSPPAADAFQRPTIPHLMPPLPVPMPPPQYPVAIPPNMIPGLVFSHQPAQQPFNLARARESESYSPPAPGTASVIGTGNGIAHTYAAVQSTPKRNQNGAGPQSKGSKKKKDRTDAKLKKQRRLEQQQQQQQHHFDQAHASSALTHVQPDVPSGNVQNPRKRRRDAEAPADDSSRRVSGKRAARTAGSPIPYIKPEPLSPPPLSVDLPPSNEPPRRLVLREDGQADIQIESPRQISSRAQRTREARYVEDLSEEELLSPRYTQPVGGSANTYASPLSTRRRVVADGHDLRRVASYQHAMRPPSPEYARYVADDMAQMRAPSRLVSARPVSRVPTYYDEQQFVHHFQAPQRHQPLYETLDEPPLSRMADRHMMPPPSIPPPSKRRIVVDEFGDEWVAVRAPSSMRQSIAPEMSYNNAPQPSPYVRAQSTRLPSQTFEQPMRARHAQVLDAERDDDFGSRQMPLQPSSRQHILRGTNDMQSPSFPYPTRQPSRAASMAPAFARDAYQRISMPLGYEVDPHPMRMQRQDRSFSTRPDLLQQAASYGQDAEYDPRAPALFLQQTR